MSAARLLSLNNDVIITPVPDLPEDMRTREGWGPDEFSVSRLRARGGSSIVDAASARLLERFREPRTLVDAVILYAHEQHADAREILEGAYPFLQSMLQRRVLVDADSAADPGQGAASEWTAGTPLPIGRVIRTLQVLDDGEVYLLQRPGGELAVLKVGRYDPARLRHEARVLARLGGRVAPRLLSEDEVEGRYGILIEYLAGVDAATAMQEYRTESTAARRAAGLTLAGAVARAYAELHGLGVLHGDVHPRNILVLRDGSVRLIDFGFAADGDTDGCRGPDERGGIPFFFEPEFAREVLNDRPPPPPSPAGEQFSVAALLFFLFTGEYWQRFPLERREMLRALAEGTPRPFAEVGAEPWPALEQVLRRGLASDPGERWPSLAALADALGGVAMPTGGTADAVSSGTSPRTERLWAELAPDARLAGTLPAPTVSINYGAAGIALGFLQASQRHGDPALLASADAWIHLALRPGEAEAGFYNPDIEIEPATVGHASPYHTPSGVHAVDALVARACGESARQERAVTRYIECASRPSTGLDLTLGRASTLLGAAILLDALPESATAAETALRVFARQALGEVWTPLEAMGPVGTGEVNYLGVAHGWAGFLYAVLTWCDVSKDPVPAGMERRLDELAALALPSGRGVEWAWVLGQAGDPPTMSGWCNGSCGYVFLWTLASRLLARPEYLAVAAGAGWNSWESLDPASTLCCGLAGRGYALLNLHRYTGDRLWLDRARVLWARAGNEHESHREYPHSLWKGELGVAVLGTDIDDPEWARMPFFEPAGYRS